MDGWRRAPYERRACDDYAPDVVRFWLTGGHWQLLEEGPKSTAPGQFGTGGDPLGLAHIKSDLEWATDQALADVLHWYATSRIYKRETRFSHFIELRQAFKLHDGLMREPSCLPVAEAVCFEMIARQLGWYPAEGKAA